MMASSYYDVLDKMEEENSSSEDEDAHIYIRAESDDLCRWYAIRKLEDTRHKKSLNELEFLSPVFKDDKRMDFFERSGCVAFNSAIYVIGGYLRDTEVDITDEVYCIDTLHPKDGWKRGPSMLRQRADSYAFTLEDGIYVMGSFPVDFDPNLPNFSEVLFPADNDGKEKKSCWRPVFHDIPDIISSGRVWAHQLTETVERQRQLLFYSGNIGKASLHSYNLDNQPLSSSWYRCGNSGTFGPKRCSCVIFLDDIMYCYDSVTPLQPLYSAPGNILGFDVKNPNSPPKVVKGLKEEKDFLPERGCWDHFPRGCLVHLGGAKLCLVLHECVDNFQMRGLLITCLKFTVSKTREPEPETGEIVELVASHLCKSSFFLEDCIAIGNCIAVPAFGGRETKEDICGKPSASRSASPAAINVRNEEGGGNATVDVKKMKRKKKKKHANTNRRRN